MKATHEITACYFPIKGEADISWEDIETGERLELTVKLSHADGVKLSRIVPARVYHPAAVTDQR